MTSGRVLQGILASLALSFVTPGALGNTPDRINEVAGLAIFADRNLWDDRAVEVAARLGLVKESETSLDAVYRSYPGGFSSVFGGMLKSVQLVAADGMPVGLSLVFSNYGDGGREAASVEASIRKDRAEVGAALDGLFGRGTTASLGRGVRREPGTKWEWSGHSFFMVHKPGGYVALRIVPSQSFGAGGVMRGRDIRQKVASRVLRRPNGDIVIGGLPMVSQGDKGYCVPAIWEMALRAMGVEADMYLLGAKMASQKGGTQLTRAVEVGRAVADSGGRRMSRHRLDGSAREFSKWIDKGIPLIWTMRASDEFISAGLERSAARRGMTEPAKWKKGWKPKMSAKDLGKTNWFAHVCLVVGYNPLTEEVAIADSWGPDHRERWHSFDEFKAVSLGEFFAFEF